MNHCLISVYFLFIDNNDLPIPKMSTVQFQHSISTLAKLSRRISLAFQFYRPMKIHLTNGFEIGGA
jgi:hypothetical protein